jgi:LPS-assembly protein
LFFLIASLLLSLSVLSFGQQNAALAAAKDDTPSETDILLNAVTQTQDSQGEWKYLIGAAKIRTSEMTITADEIDFNQDTAWAYARGHVHLVHYATGDVLNADHGEYNLKTEEGKFFVVNGTSPAKIVTSVGLLTTTNPFYYQGEYADRIKGRLILHNGYITDCKIPKPWWTFKGPVFDIVPGQHAIARRSVFTLKHIPVFYVPYFYRKLGKNTRQSGLLSPSAGHSTILGYEYGAGYYWAINRSYDLDYLFNYYTQRGTGHSFDFRGKPNAKSTFTFSFFGVQDKGIQKGGSNYTPECSTTITSGCWAPPAPNPNKQGGVQFQGAGKTEIFGFKGMLDVNYLSSFTFAAAFTNNFNPQQNSVGFLQRHFDNDIYALNIVFSRSSVYEGFGPEQKPVVIRKLPSIEGSSRLKQILEGKLPLWFSFDASSGLLSRSEPGTSSTASISTGYLNQRTDVKPTVSSAFSFAGFSLYPSVSFEGTDYNHEYTNNSSTAAEVAAANLFRHDADFVVDFRFPLLQRTFQPAKWLHLGDKMKHVIEAEAQYEYLTGISRYERTIHIDGTDILADTNQLTVGLTNRLYKKEKNGDTHEVLTWRLRQARYFDPTFGGTVVAGQRNVVLAQELITPFTFLDGPRSYSPITSSLTINPYNFFGISYDTSYDPRHHRFDNQSFSGNFRHQKYFFNIGETAITTNQLYANGVLLPDAQQLFPLTNQAFFGGGYGSTNRQGFNVAAQYFYDFLHHETTFSEYQVSYNSNCCGFSVEIRRINNVIRNDNQYLFSFSVANIGSVGTLPRQSRIF